MHDAAKAGQRFAKVWIKGCALLGLCLIAPAYAQTETGELRLQILDSNGSNLSASVTVARAADGSQQTMATSDAGVLDLRPLPYGVYGVQVRNQGFAPAAARVVIRSEIPVTLTLRLGLAPITTNLQVTASAPLLDPQQTSSQIMIGRREIQDRVSSLPGRAVQDVVNSQPGWFYEGNAVLHPRGSEYQTQFVVDGIPLTDNRSPGFGPEIEAGDLQSISIYTAGIPAEFGRVLGGVVELNTRPMIVPGLHGSLALSGGSYDTLSGSGQLQKVWRTDALDVSASEGATSHYLNPVVLQNYTNSGTDGDFAVHFDRELSRADQLTLGFRHEFSRFLIPNELVQQQAGQLQHGDNAETMGDLRYQHIFSANSVATLAGMVRHNGNGLTSNPQSTPILAFQQNHFSEAYGRATLAIEHSRHQLKAGVDSDNIFLNESLNYTITDPTQFDASTPASLQFSASRPELEQSGFLQDLFTFGQWTLGAGLRWDHYQLLLNKNAFSPRISIARNVPMLKLVLHASLDRVFQTPSFENILISSSPQIQALNGSFLRLPVQPSQGTYYEAGVAKELHTRIRLDANVYRRNFRNYADDDQLLNTGISYPIAFNKATIYGAEAKLELLAAGRLDGYASYSYMLGNAWYPVTGGLFLGDDAAAARLQTAGHFPDSQDQRNTLRTRLRFQLLHRAWLAAGAQYGSGLPFEYGGTETQALQQYGASVVDRLNFKRGRILPLLAVDSSLGIELYTRDQIHVNLQADGDNLNDRLNVMDFGGLFSGNAIAPGRSYAVRVNTEF